MQLIAPGSGRGSAKAASAATVMAAAWGRVISRPGMRHPGSCAFCLRPLALEMALQASETKTWAPWAASGMANSVTEANTRVGWLYQKPVRMLLSGQGSSEMLSEYSSVMMAKGSTIQWRSPFLSSERKPAATKSANTAWVPRCVDLRTAMRARPPIRNCFVPMLWGFDAMLCRKGAWESATHAAAKAQVIAMAAIALVRRGRFVEPSGPKGRSIL